MEDINRQSPAEIFREWFSINGGTHFGFTRLGYFIGYSILLRLIEKYQAINAITLWKESNFFDEVGNVLLELRDNPLCLKLFKTCKHVNLT